MASIKLAIGGLKVSPPLAQIVMRAGARPAVPEVFRRLADQRINMTLVALENDTGQLAGTCCIDQADQAMAEALLGEARRNIDVSAPVTSLTLYPHKARLSLLQAVLGACARAAIPVRAVASSLSALSLVIDPRHLDEALAALGHVAELPANHAPLHPFVQVRQV